MSLDYLDEETQPGYPMLPHWNDARWETATVRPKTRHMTELRNLPREKVSASLLLVYSGDVVSIMREMRYGDWIAAKVGYKLGWLNYRHVDFMLMDIFDDRSNRHIENTIPSDLMRQLKGLEWEDPDETLPSRNFYLGGYEDEIEDEDEDDASLSQTDVKRIIKHLKGIAGVFRSAKNRRHR
jgi:hypothetical protein